MVIGEIFVGKFFFNLTLAQAVYKKAGIELKICCLDRQLSG
jgi:hypothetical protein